jgi:hypothetical protein
MRHLFVLSALLFISSLGFAQYHSGIVVKGKIPDALDSRFYQIQIGAY